MYVGLQIDNVSRETLMKIQNYISDLMSADCVTFNYKCARCRNRHECDALCDFAQQIDMEINSGRYDGE